MTRITRDQAVQNLNRNPVKITSGVAVPFDPTRPSGYAKVGGTLAGGGLLAVLLIALAVRAAK